MTDLETAVTTVYLSGPMTGYANWNYPTFAKAADRLRELGHTVLNPAENDGGSTHRPRADYIRMDLHNLLEAEAVAVLTGWERSRGARLEVEIGLQLGLPILSAETLQPIGQISFSLARRYAGDGDHGYLLPEGAVV